MASRLKRSAHAHRMAKRPSRFWRKATPAENLKLAGSSTAGRFVSASVPKGEAKRNSVSITATEFKTKQNLERYGEALSPSQAAKRRAEGTLGYTSRTAAEQAERTRSRIEALEGIGTCAQAEGRQGLRRINENFF